MYTVVMVMALSTGADTPGIVVPGRCFGWPGASGFSNCYAGRACSGSGSYSGFHYYAQQEGFHGPWGGGPPITPPLTFIATPHVTSPEKTQPPKEETTEATIVVSLPAGAKLSFDGQATQQDSETRVFMTPPLEAGKISYYQLRAEMVLAGRNRILVQQIMVRAGEETRVQVDFANSTVNVRR